MKTVLFFLFVLSITNALGQKDFSKLTQPIIDEGKKLYRSEMASWHGTDIFMEKYKQKENIGGYFSYTENEITKCIFFSKDAKVIGTISFDSTYNPGTATTDLAERDFNPAEKDLYTIRKYAFDIIVSDTLFKTYTNTNLNVIPLISGNEKKVYVLTASQQSGVVLFGNDYLLTFDKNNNLITKKRLHRNLIPVYYTDQEETNKPLGTMHSHASETGDFMTATDICTLMLYARYADWKQHTVVSEKYMSIWNCETQQLNVIPMEAMKKIWKDQEKKKDRENKQ